MTGTSTLRHEQGRRSPEGAVDAFARVWPAPRTSPGTAVLVTCPAAGLVAASVLPFREPGLNVALVAGLVALACLPAVHRRLDWRLGALAVLSAALVSTVVLRDAGWVVVGAVGAASGTASLALTDARGWVAAALSPVTVPVAAVLAPRWAARTIPEPKRIGRRLAATVRVAAVTGGLLLVFGALFATADAAFADLIARATVDLSRLPTRLFVGSTVTVLALAMAYVGLAPPRWEAIELPPGPARRRAEWAVPLVFLDVLFLVFATVQLTVLFGGHERVLESAGLTYAEYARRGFAQLLVATVLTLGVVAAAVRWAPRRDSRDRTLVRGTLGVLCVATLVVVASALRRLALYEEAYGSRGCGSPPQRSSSGSASSWSSSWPPACCGAGAGWRPRRRPRPQW